jgi:hypothetical protein
MVKGLDIFTEFFKEYNGNYLLIGGSACDIHLTNAGLDFRATKDLDIVLIIEAYNSAFVNHFWNFIKEGNFQNRQKSSGEKQYYRFTDPKDERFQY